MCRREEASQRFVMDIVYQLRLHAACEELCDASDNNAPIAEPFGKFANEFASWQARHGYEGRVNWRWTRLDAALDRLGSHDIDSPRRPTPYAKVPFAKVKEDYSWAETATSRLAEAMIRYSENMDAASP